jgi:hypothetical protein
MKFRYYAFFLAAASLAGGYAPIPKIDGNTIDAAKVKVGKSFCRYGGGGYRNKTRNTKKALAHRRRIRPIANQSRKRNRK